MFRHPGKTTLLLAMAIMLSYSLGCILSPEEEIRPDPNPVEDYKDLTAPQNLIDNLVLCYKNKDAVKYEELLLSTDDGDYGREYYWFFQEGDVTTLGEESIPRDIDAQRTRYMFAAANQSPEKQEHPIIDKLQLEIYDGTWTSADSLWGEPCEDCWYTKRQYYISILIGEDTIYGDDFVQFYVVPVQEGEVTTYRIALALDVLI